MQVEGIVLHKTPYKERDLICQLLLRSGNVLNVYFYGGKGGGRQLKGSIIEVGFMLRVELQTRRKKIETDVHIAKEYSLLWNSEKIRENFNAFYLSCFYLEYSAKFAVTGELESDHFNEQAGIFKVLSNSLFFLDDAVNKNNFQKNTHLFLFLQKLIVELGVTPDINNCLYCGELLKVNELCLFNLGDGGFSCHDCSSQKDVFLSEDKNLFLEFQSSGVLRSTLGLGYKLPFKEYESLPKIDNGLPIAVFNYINYQFGFKSDNIKTWKTVSV